MANFIRLLLEILDCIVEALPVAALPKFRQVCKLTALRTTPRYGKELFNRQTIWIDQNRLEEFDAISKDAVFGKSIEILNINICDPCYLSKLYPVTAAIGDAESLEDTAGEGSSGFEIFGEDGFAENAGDDEIHVQARVITAFLVQGMKRLNNCREINIFDTGGCILRNDAISTIDPVGDGISKVRIQLLHHISVATFTTIIRNNMKIDTLQLGVCLNMGLGRFMDVLEHTGPDNLVLSRIRSLSLYLNLAHIQGFDSGLAWTYELDQLLQLMPNLSSLEMGINFWVGQPPLTWFQNLCSKDSAPSLNYAKLMSLWCQGDYVTFERCHDKPVFTFSA